MATIELDFSWQAIRYYSFFSKRSIFFQVSNLGYNNNNNVYMFHLTSWLSACKEHNLVTAWGRYSPKAAQSKLIWGGGLL